MKIFYRTPLLFIAVFSLSALSCGGGSSEKKGNKENAEKAGDETPSASDDLSLKPAVEIEGSKPSQKDADLALLAGELRSSEGAFVAKIAWLEGPYVGKDSSLELTLLRADRSQPKSIRNLLVFPWMAIHSHDSGMLKPTTRVKSAEEANVLIVEKVVFHMSGPWELNVRAEVDGRSDSVQFEIEVP